MRINIAPKKILERILERKRWDEASPEPVNLSAMLKEILSWANRFVPSESGSILLDDPVLTKEREKAGHLYFVACFGRGSSKLVGTSLPADVGIFGRTYKTGRSYISREVAEDRHFYPDVDRVTKFRTRSVICAPVKIKGVTIGVIELINRLGRINYDKNDLSLLRIFAGYTSTLIQNSLDARRFSELSIRDNLTGLYNDRYLLKQLEKEIRLALKRNRDLALVFLDLDRFKDVNDNHGHLAGSGVLNEVGAILSGYPYKNNATVARYGGDEFVIILPDTDMEEAMALADGIRRALENHVFLRRRGNWSEKALRIKGLVTCSMGVDTLRNASCDGSQSIRKVRDRLLKRADTAMYMAKKSGRNKVVAP